jgi:glycosyltransferase involved in cell wall biosynthesis
LRLIDKKVLKYIACSQSIKKDLEKIGIDGQKIKVIYNGVDLPVHGEKTFFDKPRIGIVGQLIYRKGHVVLLEAAKLLKEIYQKQFVIYVIGSGDQRYTNGLLEYVRQNSLEDYVQFKGQINSISEIYTGIDLTVVPSFSEAFGLIAVESYFHKIPVIASRVGGLEEIVLHEKTGYLFTPGNADELANRISLFLEAPAMIKTMADEGFEYCRSRFLKDTMLTKLIMLVDNL